ncbi:hypothetical protein [Streptomyces sp. NPDC012466]|jgi:hypothetical protein|uniref:hypothetical protein n=1 Tax=Streptomyces sp. NPDC012466 TaxID=3364835 RepID=UPI0036E130C6
MSALILAVLLAALDQTIVSTALPRIALFLKPFQGSKGTAGAPSATVEETAPAA